MSKVANMTFQELNISIEWGRLKYFRFMWKLFKIKQGHAKIMNFHAILSDSVCSVLSYTNTCFHVKNIRIIYLL